MESFSRKKKIYPSFPIAVSVSVLTVVCRTVNCSFWIVCRIHLVLFCCFFRVFDQLWFDSLRLAVTILSTIWISVQNTYWKLLNLLLKTLNWNLKCLFIPVFYTGVTSNFLRDRTRFAWEFITFFLVVFCFGTLVLFQSFALGPISY